MSSSLILLAIVGAAAALDYAPAVKDYSYGYESKPSYYGFNPEHKYSYTPYGGYGYHGPAYSNYAPKYGYEGHGYGAPSYGFSKYGYGVPSYGYGHPSPYGGYGVPHYASPIPYGFPKGYGSYEKYEVPTYSHPSYGHRAY